MTHLYIEQNNGITENVLFSVISKLYELALSGDLDESSDLIGRLHTNATYLEYIDFLTNKFLNLYISTDKVYILFKDENIKLILLDAGIGDGIGISVNDAANASFTNGMFASNDNITQFPEFKYFTKVNTNSVGLTWLFQNSSLTSIDLSNTTKL